MSSVEKGSNDIMPYVYTGAIGLIALGIAAYLFLGGNKKTDDDTNKDSQDEEEEEMRCRHMYSLNSGRW